jgi:hypothetical protein
MVATLPGKSIFGRYSINRLLIASILAFSILFPCCKPNEKEVRILFTGDILLSRNVQLEIDKNKISPWIKLSPVFKSADLVMGNLEGTITDLKEIAQSECGSPVFIIRTSSLHLLSYAGFNAVCIENNHSSETGETAKTVSIETLYKSGIAAVSFNNSPCFFNFNNATIAIIAINIVPGRNHSHQVIPSLEIKQKLRLARSLANLVVVSIHWGSELLEWPSLDQRNAALWLINNGADLLIGHHPHVVQKPEVILGKPVFFSLGNHLFDQKYGATKEGLIADCRISKGYLNCSGLVTHTAKNSFYPEIITTSNFDLPQVKLGKNMEIMGITLNPKSTCDTNQPNIILDAVRDGKELWRTHPMPIISITLAHFDRKNEYILTLEKHYSTIDGEIGLRPYVYKVTNRGLISLWRGSALAWPLLDALILPTNNQILCALHRGDAFVNLNPDTKKTRVAVYKWNGFGFTGVEDPAICDSCRKLLDLKR